MIDKSKIVLHQKEDGSVQLRDNISFLWCACSNPAVHIIGDDFEPHIYKCVKCYKEDMDSNRPPVEYVAWVFRHLRDHTEEGGTFRYLIYDRMGFKGEDWNYLREAGGEYLSMLLDEAADEKHRCDAEIL